MTEEANPLGAVLAGGEGSRLGGSKAKVELGGRPLISYPLAAFTEAGIETIVVAKADSELPDLDAPVVAEPPKPRHPLLGIVTALAEADGRPVVVCACDTPFVTAAVLTELASSRTTAAIHDGVRVHPLIARYQPADRRRLRAALDADQSATSALEALYPALIEVDARTAFNVNSPADLEHAASILSGYPARRGRPPDLRRDL